MLQLEGKTHVPSDRLDYVYRYQLPLTDRSADLPVGFLNRLKAFDPQLEVLFNNETKKWYLYLLKTPGASPAGDLLVKQRELPGNPGFWLFELLNKCMYRNMTALQFVKTIMDHNTKIAEKKNKEKLSLITDARKEFNEKVKRGKVII